MACLEAPYIAKMSASQGRPFKPARLVVGTLIIKHRLNLSDEAREISEGLIDELHKEAKGKKPRTYRQQARKAYLSLSKRKRAGR